MKELLKIIVAIPNLPFMTALAFYVSSKIQENTGDVEMEFVDPNNFITEDIKEYMQSMYPKPFKYLVACTFYSLVTLSILF